MAIGTQFGFALAGFTPTIAGALMGGDADNWYRSPRSPSAPASISAIAVLTGPERHPPSCPPGEVGAQPVAPAAHGPSLAMTASS